MLKLEADKMRNATAKAKAEHPRVRVISADDREYAVTNKRGVTYVVKFVVVNGKKLAECECPARGVCYHMAAAAAVNMGIQSMRQGAKVPAAGLSVERMEQFYHRNVGWQL